MTTSPGYDPGPSGRARYPLSRDSVLIAPARLASQRSDSGLRGLGAPYRSSNRKRSAADTTVTSTSQTAASAAAGATVLFGAIRGRKGTYAPASSSSGVHLVASERMFSRQLAAPM